MSDFLRRDVPYALRLLRRSPGYAAAAGLTLALGIGTTTAIYALLHAVVLDPLPYPDSHRLVAIDHPVPGLNPEWRWGLSEAGYHHFLEHERSLEELGIYERWGLAVAGEGTARRARAAGVSAGLLRTLGAHPALGRLLAPEDNEPGAPRVAVLGHAFWVDRFGADSSLVGRRLEVEGLPVEVVGVAAEGFDLPDQETDLWMAVTLDPAARPVNWHRFDAIARLEPGTTVEAAEADLRRLVGRFTDVLPAAYDPDFMQRSGFDVRVTPLRDHVVGDVAGVLWTLLGAVGVVLLIACGNVANLFLVRLEGRRREIAIRTAMGASRGALAGLHLAESGVLAALGAAAGLGLAFIGIRILVAFGPGGIPRLSRAGLGWEALAFALVVAGTAALAFGALPLWRRRVEADALREGARGLTASRRGGAVRSALVAGQVGLAFVLLSSAALLLQTFRNLREVDPGFEPEGALALDVSLPFAKYPGFEEVARFYRELTERVEALPGVVASGATQQLPMEGGGPSCSLLFTDDPEAMERMRHCFADPVQVTPGYLRAMGIPVEGRTPDWNDTGRRSGEAVVTRALVAHVWPDGDAIGRGIRGDGDRPPYYRISGIAGDVRAGGLDRPPVERVYFPMLPIEGAGLWGAPRSMTLVVRVASGPAGALVGPIQNLVRELDPSVPVGNARSMERVVAASMERTTFAMALLGIAAAVALFLGLVGLYGLVAYVVERRRPEIGIRMALGARTGKITRAVLGRSARLAGLGIAVGVVGALATAGLLRSLLFGITPGDPLVLAAAAALLLGAALLASLVPARRAARIDPAHVLRLE